MEKIKILVIGQNQDVIEPIQKLSDTYNYEIVLHNDLTQALLLIERQQNLCNMILIDCTNKQILNGDDLENIKKTSLNTPTIIVCSNEQLRTISNEVCQGLTALLIKPINLEMLRFSIDRLFSNYATVLENKVLMKLTRLQVSHVGADRLVGKSMSTTYIRELVEQFSQSKEHVLILGEKGTGKKLISRIIYGTTKKEQTEYLALDCESFTTADIKNILFDELNTADGTAYKFKNNILNSKNDALIVFNQIQAMNKDLQNMLLQAMDVSTDRIRVIATSNTDLKLIAFNKNLLFKLNMIEIRIPPLRERREDIPELIEYFNYKYSSIYLSPPKKFELEIIEHLKSRDWTENVFELESLIRKIILNSKKSALSLTELNAAIAELKLSSESFDIQYLSQKNTLSLDEMINRYIVYVLSLNSGVKEKTARDLKIDRKTLYRRLKEIDS